MKAAIFQEYGGPEVIKYEDVAAPQPQPGEVLLQVRASALNHLDIWIRQGIPAYDTPMPHISGCDSAGAWI